MTDYLSMLTPEELLLLRLCRLEFDEDQKKEIASLVAKVMDWNLFVTLANDHGIIALCRFNLVNLGFSDILPGDILKKLTESYLASVARNTKIFRLLDEVLLIAQNAGIEVVLLKGVALELTVYGNQGIRQMSDLDILVKRDDAVRLRKILLTQNYFSQPFISPLHEKILPSLGKHLPEMGKYGLTIDIHYKLFDEKDDFLTSQFSASSELQNFEAILHLPCLIPNPTWHTVYLLHHLKKHEIKGISQLRLYYDLVVLISYYLKNPILPDLFVSLDSSSLLKCHSDRLFLMKEIWGLSFPDGLLNLTEEEKKNSIEKFINVLKQQYINRGEKIDFSIFKTLKEINNKKDKLIFIIGYLFPSPEFMKYRYSVKSLYVLPLFYPIRWATVVLKTIGIKFFIQ